MKEEGVKGRGRKRMMRGREVELGWEKNEQRRGGKQETKGTMRGGRQERKERGEWADGMKRKEEKERMRK